MTLDPPCIGAVGCAKEFKNPIDAAKDAFYDARESKKMSRYNF